MGQDNAPEDEYPPEGRGSLTQISQAGPEASALFTELHAQCFPTPWPQADFERLLASSGVMGLIMQAHGKPVGLSLIRTIAGECEILTIGIAKDARRSGFGAQLLTASETTARLGNARRMILEVSHTNKAAVALYDRVGYLEIGRRTAYYRDGSDARVMARKL